MPRKFESSGLTGKIIEKELLGESLYNRYSENVEVGGDWKMIELAERYSILKRLQPFESIDHAPDFVKTVHSLIAQRLGIEPKFLKFYTAVESPVDWNNKIDCWFQILRRKGEEPLRVTIDITTNPEKGLPKYPADIPDFVVPQDGLDIHVDKDQFLDYAVRLADEVSGRFKLLGINQKERKANEH